MRAAALLLLALSLSAPAAAAPRAYSAGDLAAIARGVFDGVNAARVAAGRPALAWDGTVAAVAAAHSDDMARRNYFGHRSRDGRSHGDRARSAGIVFRRFGENILKVDNPRESPDRLTDTIVVGFLGSPAHRGGIMARDFKSTGVGVARAAATGAIVVTQDFLDPAGGPAGSPGGKGTIRLPFGIKIRRR